MSHAQKISAVCGMGAPADNLDMTDPVLFRAAFPVSACSVVILVTLHVRTCTDGNFRLRCIVALPSFWTLTELTCKTHFCNTCKLSSTKTSCAQLWLATAAKAKTTSQKNLAALTETAPFSGVGNVSHVNNLFESCYRV